MLVRQVLERVWEKGDIYKSNYEGYYCTDCEEYKDEKDLNEHHDCPTHLRPCTYKSEENYFFKLSKYQDEIERLITSTPDFVSPPSRRGP